MVAVARESRLIVGQWVTRVVDWVGTQLFADALPVAARYCTDGGSVYPVVAWPGAGAHVVSVNKDETYTIEGINADLRTYLGRLKRRSRCFSRSIEKLEEAMRLFVWHYNRRRRVINLNPAYRDTLPLLF
jgi:insertion element IS1 protein InsB